MQNFWIQKRLLKIFPFSAQKCHRVGGKRGPQFYSLQFIEDAFSQEVAVQGSGSQKPESPFKTYFKHLYDKGKTFSEMAHQKSHQL